MKIRIARMVFVAIALIAGAAATTADESLHRLGLTPLISRLRSPFTVAPR